MQRNLRGSLQVGLLALVLIGGVGCVQVYGPPETASTVAGTSTAKHRDKADAEDADEKGEKGEKDKKDLKPWKEVLEDTEAREGFFTTHLKKDRTLLLELPPKRLDRDFGMVVHLSRGTGVFNLHDGLVLSATRLLRFHRVGNKVYLVDRNPLFTADAGSPMAVSLEDNVGHSILAGFDVQSEHEETGHLLIDVTPFFVSDHADIARGLKSGYFDDKPVGFDKDRSYLARVQGFPRNLELDVELTFTPSEPPEGPSAGVSDWRSIPVGVRYSLFALPEEPMRPRRADDRVGYFLQAVKDFSRDREETLYVRNIRRWRLEKKNPGAELSEPVRPIVYWVDRSVPAEYRRWVKEGIEGWNKAFEAAGFQNAVVAKIAPTPEEDPDWSAEDVRYSTVRWTAAHRMGYAIGPSQMDPRTGELLNADILVSSSFVTGWRYNWEELADPRTLVLRRTEAERRMRELAPEQREVLCFAEMGMAHQLGVQHALLAGMDVLDGEGPLPEEFLGPAIRDLVLHEVGHTLGLRHNFKSSSGTPFERLHDTAFTGENGVSLSVMDYVPVNVSPDPGAQGHYWNPAPGSYDLWAIRYGYATMVDENGEPITDPDAETPHLEEIARQGADPFHTYGTDEDNWLGPWAVDPLTSAWDLGSDPMAFAEQRTALVSRIKPRLEGKLIQQGEGYQRLRGALARLTFEQWGALSIALRTVGGLYYARDHKGDPDQRPPFTPVAAETQRRAVRLITSNAFTDDAFGFTPEMLNRMAPNRWAHWGSTYFFTPVDFPVHQQILFLQELLLRGLMHPARLARVLDNEVRMPEGGEPYRLSELLGSLSASIWNEVLGSGGDIGSVRRNLQRAHLDLLTDLLLQPRVEETPVPPDARALARWELTRLSERLGESMEDDGLDVYTRAHLTESKARIDRALEASLAVVVQ